MNPRRKLIRPPDYVCLTCGDRWSGSEPVEYSDYIREQFERKHAGHLTNLVNVKPNDSKRSN